MSATRKPTAYNRRATRAETMDEIASAATRRPPRIVWTDHQPAGNRPTTTITVVPWLAFQMDKF